MVDLARLQIQIDSSGVKTAGRDLEGLARKGTQVGQKLTTRLSLPLAAGMAGAVREAALLEGAFDKFDVVFQGMTTEMRQFVDVYNKEFPISRRETVQLAASLQDLLVPMGVNREEAAGMTKDWLELAGALSAFNDVPIQDVLQAVSSGMAGQSESLRRYGIDARATVLENIALEQGLIRVGEAMSEQVRQQALLIQATKQSADAIGGLEEQKGSLLWQTEELKRDVKDLAAVYGKELMPVAKDLIGTAQDMATWFKNLDGDTQKLIVKSGLLVTAVGPAVGGLSWAYIGASKAAVGMAKATRVLTAAMIANPYLAVGAAVLALGGYIASTERGIRSLNRELDNIFGGGADSIDQVNQAIIEMEDRISRSKGALSSMVADPESTDTIRQMRIELERLVLIRDSMAVDQMDAIISSRAVETVNETTRAVDELIRSVEGVKIAAQKPEDWIFDPVEAANIRQIRQEAEEFRSVFDDILNTDYDFSHRLGLPEVKKDLEDLNYAAIDMGWAFSNAFGEAIMGSESLGSALEGLLQDILRISTQALILDPLAGAITGKLGGSGIFNKIFGRATGGPVSQGSTYMVGEKGPEIFRPNQSGTIVPNHEIRSGSSQPNVNVNVSVQNESSNASVDVQQQKMPNGDVELVAIIRDINRGLHNSGQMDKTMAQNYGVRRKGQNYG